ncbi:MAG: flagellar motor switch protein FliN [Myxococcales bacterium]|nr:flagellar motor switch protein FliN [Myxococcales bacterium]
MMDPAKPVETPEDGEALAADPAPVPSATSLPDTAPSQQADPYWLLRDVHVELTLEIGRRRMRVAEVLKLGVGHTLELNKAAGEPVDVYVNGQLLGRGEPIVVGDRYGVRLTELVAGESSERPS